MAAASIVTPVGQGGISVIQISGDDVPALLSALFVPSKRTVRFDRTGLYYGHIVSEGAELDEVVVAYFPVGAAQSGVSLAEINCHGGLIASEMVIEAFEKAGAQRISPEEMIPRLAGTTPTNSIVTEATHALLQARTRLAAKVLARQMTEGLALAAGTIKRDCEALLRETKAGRMPPKDRLEAVIQTVAQLVLSSRYGMMLTRPLTVSLVGKPNVGKSSVFNALCKAERVLVHPVAGTTRDYINVTLAIRGIPFEIIDTAGIRKTDDYIEKLSVEKTLEVARKSEAALVILDALAGVSPEERAVIRDLAGKKCIYVINKIDMLGEAAQKGFRGGTFSSLGDTNGAQQKENESGASIPERGRGGGSFETDRRCGAFGSIPRPQVLVSAFTGEGIDELEDAIIRGWCPFDFEEHRAVVFTHRQKDLLSEVLAVLEEVAAESAVSCPLARGRRAFERVLSILERF